MEPDVESSIEMVRAAEARRARHLLLAMIPSLDLATVTLGRAGELKSRESLEDLRRKIEQMAEHLPAF